jgi:protein-disulfide isomerase
MGILFSAGLTFPGPRGLRAFQGFAAVSLTGALISFYFVYLQLRVLHKTCPGCLALAVTTAFVFGVAGTIRNNLREGRVPVPSGGAVGLMVLLPMLLGPAALALTISGGDGGKAGEKPILEIGKRAWTQADFEKEYGEHASELRTQAVELQDRWADEKLHEWQLDQAAAARGESRQAFESRLRSDLVVDEALLGGLQGKDREARKRELEEALLEEALRKAAEGVAAKVVVRKHWTRPVPTRVRLDAEGLQTDGPATAPVLVVLSSDFECPFCRRTAGHLSALRKEFGERVRVAYLHNPLPSHKGARLAAAAAECAGSMGKFWEFRAAVMKRPVGVTLEGLVDCAREVGLDPERFRAELGTGRYEALVDAQRKRITTLGLSAVPVFIVNGRVFQGAIDPGTLRKAVEEALRP